jgi:methylated-DNA-[protein]-cysteine S-methyltransferase
LLHQRIRSSLMRRVLSEVSRGAIASSVVPATTITRFPTPFDKDLIVVSDGTQIVESSFGARRRRHDKPTDALLVDVASQIRAYFARRLARFDVPLRFEGTPLRVAAWRAVASLRFAEFVSYADVARAIGRPTAHRGIASAMSASPFDLFVPAHRVVGADGRVRGAAPGSMRARLVHFERSSPSS